MYYYYSIFGATPIVASELTPDSTRNPSWWCSVEPMEFRGLLLVQLCERQVLCPLFYFSGFHIFCFYFEVTLGDDQGLLPTLKSEITSGSIQGII